MLVALVALVALAGCSRVEGEGAARRDEGLCACDGPAPVVDATLLAFLSKARAAHHDADLAEERGDRDAAVKALERVVVGPVPGGAAPPPEAAEVLADTLARLADLRSAAGDFDAAERDAARGLALASDPTYFRGHLFEVRGLVRERRAAALAAGGDAAAAAAQRRAAVADFEEAIGIQDRVIERALDGGPR
jgi:tetratricopeptide (TPR) repeat protein